MSVMMVRQKIKPECIAAVQAGGREMYAALARVRPEGIRYASARVADSATFVILVELPDDGEDPRLAIPEYQRFLEQLQDFVDGPPVIEHLEFVGSYRLFGPEHEVGAGRQGG